jgi:hypothetical protein
MIQFRVFRIGTLKKRVDRSIAVIPSSRYYQVTYLPPDSMQLKNKNDKQHFSKMPKYRFSGFLG